MSFFEFKEGILYFKAQNQHHLAHLTEAFHKAFADRRFIPNKTPLYLDVNPSLTGLESEEIRQLVKYMAKHRVSRVAVMVSDTFHFGLARLCYRFFYTEGIQAKVFTESVKAKAYCAGVAEEPVELLRCAY